MKMETCHGDQTEIEKACFTKGVRQFFFFSQNIDFVVMTFSF